MGFESGHGALVQGIDLRFALFLEANRLGQALIRRCTWKECSANVPVRRGADGGTQSLRRVRRPIGWLETALSAFPDGPLYVRC